MNVILKGKAKEAVELMVKAGYANTFSEAIRLAIISFKKEYLTEEELMNRKIEFIENEAKAGRRKWLTPEEALGEYAKYLKPKKENDKSIVEKE